MLTRIENVFVSSMIECLFSMCTYKIKTRIHAIRIEMICKQKNQISIVYKNIHLRILT